MGIDFFLKFLKFGVVGTAGVVIDFGITYLLKEKAGWRKYIANSLGFTCATVSNYTWNRLWTFKSENPHVYEQFGQFFLIALIGLLINNTVVYLFNDRLKLPFYISKVLAIAVVVFWNFFANYFITFNQNF